MLAAVSGKNTEVEALETTFQQDLNGYVTKDIVTTEIKREGASGRVQFGNNFYLYNGGTGPELKYAGAAVTVGEFGSYTPIGAVQVAGGYDVAWKDPNSGLYSVWSTNSNGKYQSNLIPAVSGNNTALQALET